MAMQEQLDKVKEWDPVEKKDNSWSSALVDSYCAFVSQEQKTVGVPVRQAAPILSHTLAQLLQSMRVSAHFAGTLSQHIANTCDIAIFTLSFYSMKRGFDFSSTLASRVLRLPESAGLAFNFLFGKTLRRSVEAVVVLADAYNAQTCAFRGVTEYISAVLALRWDLTAGHLFPVVECDGERGSVAVTCTPRDGRFARISLRRGLTQQFHYALVYSGRIA